MGLLDLNGIKREVQNLHGEFCLKKEEIQHQTNETTCGDKTDNTNYTTNIYNNYGSTLSTDTQGYIAQCVKELFEKSEEEFYRRVRAYINERIDEKFEEIKANFVPKTAEPKLEIVGTRRTIHDISLYIRNLGDIEAENVSIKIPEDEKACILTTLGEKGAQFELKDFVMPAGSCYDFYENERSPAHPRRFHVDYSYWRNGELKHKSMNMCITWGFGE